MAISEIKQYRQKDGTDILKVFTKPTKRFPDGGYFYVDAKDIDVIQNYNWGLIADGKNIVVATNTCSVYSYRKFLVFHQELAYVVYKHGVTVTCITEENHPEGLFSPDAFNGKGLFNGFIKEGDSNV